jgi:hypothetical protein
MQLRPDIQIQSVMKSLKDVVLPALDPNNNLALEQGQLIMGMLHVMSQRLPLEYRFDCDELARLLELSSRLRDELTGGDETAAAIEGLRVSRDRGADVLDRARAEPSEVYGAVKELRSKIARVVQCVSKDGDGPSRVAMAASVRAASAEQLKRDRAWVIGQGWEPDPTAIPSIESLLTPRVAAKSASSPRPRRPPAKRAARAPGATGAAHDT